MAAALGIFVLGVPRTFACDDLTVRDAAFQEPRDNHRLCLMAAYDDSLAADIHIGLEDWLAAQRGKLNIELVSVDLNDPQIDWPEYGIPSAPPSSPVVVLAGHHAADRRTFFVDVWEPGPDSSDLKRIAASPAREAIREGVLRHTAVLLHVPASADSTSATDRILQETTKLWAQKNPLGISVVRVDRSNPQERLLLSFIGAKPGGPDWVAVVFGPGKFMAPLVGEDITEAALSQQIASLTAACTCMQTPSRLGVDLPMIWDDSFNAALVALAPAIAGEQEESDVVPVGVSDLFGPRGKAAGSTWSASVLVPTLLAVGVLLIVSIMATLAVLWKKGRRPPAPVDR
jgi:hypothetical protein